jgi:hypothetical protein
MVRGHIDSERKMWRYIERLADFGVRQFTFKHTYIAYERSVFAASAQDRSAAEHRVALIPLKDKVKSSASCRGDRPFAALGSCKCVIIMRRLLPGKESINYVDPSICCPTGRSSPFWRISRGGCFG